MKTDIIQKAVILNSKGQVLILKRSQTNLRKPGQLDLPGGFLDSGESLENGIQREIREEVGFESKNSQLVFAKTEVRRWYVDGAENERNSIFLFYISETDIDTVKLSPEHQSYQWLELDEVVGKCEDEILNEVLSHIQENKLLEV